MGPFIGEVDPSRHHAKVVIWQFGKGFNLAIWLGWMKLLKMGQEKVYISYNYSCAISFLVEILLVKLK